MAPGVLIDAQRYSFFCEYLYEEYIYEGRTESHEQLFFFLHANWEQQTKDSAVVDGASCVILECLVTSIACIT